MYVIKSKARVFAAGICLMAFLAIGTYIAYEESHWSKMQKMTPESMPSLNRRLSSASIADANPDDGSNKHMRFTNGQMVIIFIFFGLFFGMVFRELKKKFHFPYAAVLIVFGGVSALIYQSTSWIGQTQDYVVGTDPELI